MPTNTADQGLTIPSAGDTADLPANLTTLVGQIEPRLIKQYTNEADRTARNASPTQGQLSWLQNLKRYEYWNDTAAAWWELLPLFARKTAESQTSNNSTTLIADTHLVLPMRANAVYAMEGLFFWDSGTTGDIKWDWTMPAAGTMPVWNVFSILSSVAANSGSLDASISQGPGNVVIKAGPGIGNLIAGTLQGICTTGATAGNLQLRWAQNAAEAVNTRMKIGSWLKLTRIG